MTAPMVNVENLPAATVNVFVPANADVITRQVDGHGRGFPHVGIRAKAHEMGFGTRYGSYVLEGTHDGAKAVYLADEKSSVEAMPLPEDWVK